MSAAWKAFVASIDLVKLERERTGIPKSSERPWSPADRQMRLLHEAAKSRLACLPTATREQTAASIAECQAWETKQHAARKAAAQWAESRRARGGFTEAQWAVASEWAAEAAS